MKEEALKLAEDLLDRLDSPRAIIRTEASAMIRRLVEELNCAEDYIKQYQLQTKSTITKLDGKVVAVTMTDDEHRVHEVLWEAPKPLSDEEILEILIDKGICGRLKDGSLCYWQADADLHDFARTIEERHGIK